jgi:hypothetical protein
VGSVGNACGNREASVGFDFEELKNPYHVLAGSLNSSWSVPPHCEYGNCFALDGGFSNVKCRLKFGLRNSL